MAFNVLIENEAFVDALRRSLWSGDAGMKDVPELLICVLRDGRWKTRQIQTGEQVVFRRFEDFAAAKPLEGLGANLDVIRRLCADNPEAVDLLDRALGTKQGERSDIVNNGNEVRSEARPVGNSRQYAMRRLRTRRPDLHARVLAREITPHAAMVEAGFRRRTVPMPTDVDGAAKVLARHFTRDEAREIMARAFPSDDD